MFQQPRTHIRTHARAQTPAEKSHLSGADLEATQETGDTALSLASFFGKPKAVAELVRRGADVRCRDIEGLTPGEVFEAEVDPTTQREIQVEPKHDTKAARRTIPRDTTPDGTAPQPSLSTHRFALSVDGARRFWGRLEEGV